MQVNEVIRNKAQKFKVIKDSKTVTFKETSNDFSLLHNEPPYHKCLRIKNLLITMKYRQYKIIQSMQLWTIKTIFNLHVAKNYIYPNLWL